MNQDTTVFNLYDVLSSTLSIFKAQDLKNKICFIMKPNEYMLKGQKQHLQQVMTLLIEQALSNGFEGNICVVVELKEENDSILRMEELHIALIF